MTREEALEVLNGILKLNYREWWDDKCDEAVEMAIESLKAEPMWITDRKPTESGRYMATVDSLGWIHVVIFRYGKPSMANSKGNVLVLSR